MLTLVGVSAQCVGGSQHPALWVDDLFGVRLVDIAAGEWWRIATASFVSRAGWAHALLNVGGLLLVSRPLERQYGTRSAATVLAISPTAAFAAAVWFHGGHWLSAGGSGAVLGCAGFLATRCRHIPTDARVGVALVMGFTFGEPLVSTAFGEQPRGSVPAHLGGLAAGAFAAVLLAAGVKRTMTLAAGLAFAGVATAPLVVSMLPEEPRRLGCGSSTFSTFRRGSDTRLMFLNPSGRDVVVRWVSPTGTPGSPYTFTPDRRGRMPWYAYSGAVYEVADSDGACILRAAATRGTTTVVIPGPSGDDGRNRPEVPIPRGAPRG